MANSNIKSTIDSILISAFLDFGSVMAQRLLSIPECNQEVADRAVVNLFFNIAKFMDDHKIDPNAAYFKHWDKIFDTDGSC